jgi:predicted transcriptional regulator
VAKKPTVPTSVPARPKKSEYIGVSVEEGLRVSVQRIAAKRDVSMSTVLRDAIREYLERHASQAA